MSGSTTELNKGEFGLYLDKICAESCVPIPDTKLLAMDSKVEYPTEKLTPTF